MVLLGGALGFGFGEVRRETAEALGSAPVVAADPWAESRRSAELLKGQEGPAPRLAIGAAPGAAPTLTAVSARFGFCHRGGGSNCVIDGDTFRLDGARIRIADIDAPETHPPRCAEEARLGAAATERLHALLNGGVVRLETADRDEDRYGRKLRIVTRGGRSLGAQLVDEGLARPWTGHRQPWC